MAVIPSRNGCEFLHDAPEINFSHSTTIVSDFSGVIKAINDMSLSLSQKLEIINNAIQNQTLTLSEKMNILNEAVNKGILTYEKMAQKTVDAINAMNASTTEKLAAVESALTNMNTSLTTKLALIEATMKTGLTEIADSEKLIQQAIESLEGTASEKLAAIEAAINAGFVSAAKEQELTRTALINSLTAGFAQNAESLAAINTAQGRLSIDDGVYGGDDKNLYVSPAAWGALKSDPEMYNTFMNSLTVYTPEVTGRSFI